MKAIFLTMIFFSTNSFALNIPFCQNPIQYTCADAKLSAAKREANVSRIEEKVKQDAFVLFKQENANDPIITDLRDYQDLDNLSPARVKKRIQKLFFKKVQITFGSYLAENKISPDLGLPQIKNALLTSINTLTNIPAEIKAKMIESVQVTKLVSMQSNVDENTVIEINNLYKQCARKGFVDNAFATTLSGQKVIMVCPGEIIGTIESLKENNINTSFYPLAEAMTLGHELSHHFDYRYFPGVYSDILAFANQNRDAFKTEPEEYMSEITADVWGLRAFLNLAVNLNHSSELYSKIIATSLNDLCGTVDDNAHPTGDFRIDRLATNLICQ